MKWSRCKKLFSEHVKQRNSFIFTSHRILNMQFAFVLNSKQNFEV